jgi:DnaK suppressor protein
MRVKLPEGYRPSTDEPFMNERHQEYFRLKLLAWREELLEDYEETRANLGNRERSEGDEVDLTSGESELALELRFRDRERKLLAKIDQALERLAEGTYGYCVETGKPIGLERLEARPATALCIEAQEEHERREALRGRADDDDDPVD